MKYTVAKCTAIAQADHGDESKRQCALMVESRLNDELAEYIVFGWVMPGNAEEFAHMCEDASAWEPLEEDHKMRFIFAPVTASFWTSRGYICKRGHEEACAENKNPAKDVKSPELPTKKCYG